MTRCIYYLNWLLFMVFIRVYSHKILLKYILRYFYWATEHKIAIPEFNYKFVYTIREKTKL